MSAAKEGVLCALSAGALVLAVRLSQLALTPLYNRSFTDDVRPTLLVLALLAALGMALRRGRSVRYAALWSAVGVALTSRYVRMIGEQAASKLGGRTAAQVASFVVSAMMAGPWALCPGGPVAALTGLILLLPKEITPLLPRILAADAERSLLLPAIALLIIGLISTPQPIVEGVPASPRARAPGAVKRKTGISLAAAAVALAFAVQYQRTRPTVPFEQNGVLVHNSTESVSGRVVVEDVETGEHTMRVLRADHSLVGGVWLMPDERGGTELGESVFAAFPLQEIALLANRPTPPGNLLVIGLGVGIGAQHYARQGYSVDIVEYDPAVVDAAEKYFGLSTVPIHSIAIQDAVTWVAQQAQLAVHEETERKYDIVVHDVFSAGSLYPALFTVGFWENAAEVMTPDGIVVMNVAAHPDSEYLRPLAAALQTVFPRCRAFHDLWTRPIGDDDMVNIVFLCSRDPIELRAYNEDDARGSYLREHVYGTYGQYELDMERILPPQEDESEAGQEDLALRDGNEWRATRAQSVLADRTWPIIQKLMRDDQWVVY